MQLIRHYFPGLSDFQVDQLAQLKSLYTEWNQKINVVSRKDIESLYLHHVLHSLAIAKVIKFADGTYVLDVGTGGGFPGIPLAILFPETQFTLIDSIGKKIKVVTEVSSALGLQNVEGRHVRVQDVKERFDFVVSRAVTALPDFMAMVKGRIRKEQINHLQNGVLYLKGGEVENELNTINYHNHVYYLSNFFKEPFFETKLLIHLF
ncbi:MAG: 16S rRNA (guanine(527)-N(7))-methyltransferase RsmG [Sphingobacteriia bacterium]|nr:16S rRNA (guanine(527)-N(7))-methyltransferase RsmG [Sphingobacteriia bacterium]